ncbi:MAG: class I SAM-dependent RNA methyltransferase [Clostridia bacterium]|nr:class I SAM-dependent RNA methyltransferase [Clostridia bacterium]
MLINFCIPCLLGLEGFIADELRALEAQNVQAENGRVLFSGDENILARVNICSRFAERVQIVVGSFTAKTFEELFQGTKALEWEQWIGARDAFPVKGYSINSTLFSVRDCQAIIKKAVVERLKSRYNVSWFDETGPVHQIQFAFNKDVVTLLLDTSGAGLHKRGYRPQSNSAPIKETLAASLCAASRLRPYHTLYDPMCGSGTILVEGAMMAMNIAPGLNRNFSCDRWEQLDRAIWAVEKERARDLEKRDCDFLAIGSDISSESVELAKINARQAGVADKIKISIADVKNFKGETEKGTLICNPPYGERLLDIEEASKLYSVMGRVFERKHGWSYTIISPSETFEQDFGRKADKRRKLYNGMIKCQVFMYFK